MGLKKKREKCAALLDPHSGCDGNAPKILLNNDLFHLYTSEQMS